jgi:hypothetical protein
MISKIDYKLVVAALSLLIVAFCGSFGAADDRPSRFAKPEDVVAWLYREFGWEALIFEYFDNDGLVDQPVRILKRYFTPKLATLIANDRKNVKRTKELGHINFVLIFGSQDPDGISNIRISKKPGTNTVKVSYDYNGEKDVMNLDYETIRTASGWKISDIHYKSIKSRAAPEPGVDFSLLKLLSQKH